VRLRRGIKLGGGGPSMNSVNEKTTERANASWLSRPVTGHAAAPNRCMHGRRDITAFWLDSGFLGDDSEPLPSMFRSKINTCGAEPRAAKTTLASLTSLAARLSKWHSANRTAPYIIASFLLLLAAVDGFLLTGFSPDRRTLAGQALEARDQDATETALMFSVPSADAAEGPQVTGQEALPEGDRWSAAVEALERFLAEEKSKAAAMKQGEKERLIRRLESWVTRTEKRTAMAEACAGPARQCWKGATRVQ
jgi:hypothetical protein